MTDSLAEHDISPTAKTNVGPLPRYGIWIIFAIFFVSSLFAHLWLLAVITGAFVILGFVDRFQQRHAILRNYPIIGHMRFILESFRTEIRQYFVESDTDEVPFSRDQRTLVYERAKRQDDTRAFGTISNLYDGGSEWMTQSIGSTTLKEFDFRIVIGGKDCLQPYSASVFNISAMSFGALSANAIRALNRGAEMGNFYHDTGEGSISPYHQESKGDIVWEIASGYFGCRTDDGHFNPNEFHKKAINPQVKMIEIKISQGAKPGLGGLLPAGKVTPEIARTREIPVAQDCVSPPSHTAFRTPRELISFIQQLRELSGGKPVGFKLCIGHPWEFMAIVKAMLITDCYPDFIVVDGAEGGTGAANTEFMDHVGMPLRDGFLMVHNTLVGAGIRDKIRVGVSGKIISGFDVARMLALGADWCNSARGFMFALGCVQSRICNTDRCPTGVATQDPYRQRALVVPDKAERVKNFHENTMKALAEIMGAVGVDHPDNLEPFHVVRRGPDGQVRLLSKHYYFVRSGSLLVGEEQSEVYAQLWSMANPDTFTPNEGPLEPQKSDKLADNSMSVSTPE
jgi:glutamate synthase domain-containing protein 2